jgi:hypothetical protein
MSILSAVMRPAMSDEAKQALVERTSNGKAPRGRRPGSKNKVATEARAFAAAVISDADYRESVWRRIFNDELPPQIEALLWYYTAGKPVERVNLTDETDHEDLEGMTPAELAQEAMKVAAELVELGKQEEGPAKDTPEEASRKAKEKAGRFGAVTAALAKKASA